LDWKIAQVRAMSGGKLDSSLDISLLKNKRVTRKVGAYSTEKLQLEISEQVERLLSRDSLAEICGRYIQSCD
jgi:hypothetical protein